MRRILLAIGILAAAWPAAAQGKITKETLVSGGTTRAYYLFVPDTPGDTPAPLIVMLHGSGRDGRILLDRWQALARKEGIVLAGPDAAERQGWNMALDGPHFLYDIVEAVKKGHSIDPRRVYLFGHSAGATHGLHLGLLESEYFAAVAAHAGIVLDELMPYASRAERKIPMALWIGTRDPIVPVAAVRQTHKGLTDAGFAAELTEINGHTHDYYGRAGQLNLDIWTFLKQHRLAGDPVYKEYSLGR
jgi:poly(3-hydroxybutyrate) depolymerase